MNQNTPTPAQSITAATDAYMLARATVRAGGTAVCVAEALRRDGRGLEAVHETTCLGGASIPGKPGHTAFAVIVELRQQPEGAAAREHRSWLLYFAHVTPSGIVRSVERLAHAISTDSINGHDAIRSAASGALRALRWLDPHHP